MPSPPRSQSGYRLFSFDSIRRIRFIKQAQELGFSLKEIKELLALRAAPGTTSDDVRKRVQSKIADIEEKMTALKAMKKTLTQLIAACCGDGAASDCPILESLDKET